ncbi:uncharacterized protein SAPINGB_P000642 [Magnusiomyces paraingens]|uniref:Rho GDP-dissociation inhibitor n=1 Tax=Magnusiomyces paraingens TaxID=2606893 RepID=A0A5E8B0V3_9ASCO|nr:uncharacterized protein SAPINGB_P000642 [Saprochaete ingens]VVT45114.1 unnamed protein product [Saprochaete ingens]
MSKQPEIDQELVAEDTAGYKVTDKKTIAEYANLDAEDDSLKKWKESLGLSTGALIGDPNDKRRVVVLELRVDVEGADPIIINLETPGALQSLRKSPIVIRERSRYQRRLRFRVQHEIITGLKYLQSLKRSGIRVDKSQEVCGSYPPNTVDKPYYEKTFAEEEAPHGMLARGTYDVTSKFVDDDGVTHLEFAWQIEIKK